MNVNCRKAVPILPVRDVRVALKRYEALGFKTEVYEAPDGTAIYGFVQREGLDLHVTVVKDLDPLKNTSAVYFYVNDPDVLYAEWTAAGIEGRLSPPEPRPWGMREMSYSDPDGNLLRIGSFLTSVK